MTQASLADEEIAAALLKLVAQRGKEASACPSEVARVLLPDGWRELMPQVRKIARQLAVSGLLDVSQGGKSVSPSKPWVGPIRIRLARSANRAADT